MMNKTITLNKTDWETVIAGLSYAYENAEENGWDDDAKVYLDLVNLITKELAK
jgi:hypothetical protein